MSEFVPTTAQVRDWYATWPTTTTNTRQVPEYLAEFDRWLAQHDAEVKAEAWDEGAQAARNEDFLADDFVETPNPYRGEDA